MNNIPNTMGRVIVISGGTGGHVHPALAFSLYYNYDIAIEERCKHYVEYWYSYLKNQFQDAFNNQTKYYFNYRYKVFDLLSNILYFINVIKNYDSVVLFGSYVCLPAWISSIILNKKIYIHEQNIILGKANRLYSIMATEVWLTFKNTNYSSSIVRGIPIMMDLVHINNIKKDTDFVILVIAGSGGSDFFDKVLTDYIVQFLQNSNLDIKIYQQCINLTLVQSKYNGYNAIISNYFANLYELFNIADLVICRGGTSSIANCIYFNSNAIIIPWSKAVNNHQFMNAQGMNYILENEISNIPELIHKCLVEKNQKNDSNLYIWKYEKRD